MFQGSVSIYTNMVFVKAKVSYNTCSPNGEGPLYTCLFIMCTVAVSGSWSDGKERVVPVVPTLAAAVAEFHTLYHTG